MRPPCRPALLLSRHLSRSFVLIPKNSSAISTSSYLNNAATPLFSSLEGKLDSSLLKSIHEEMGFEHMTPVQDQLLNGLPSFKADCLVQANPGTGKTIAFLLPAIQNLLQHSPRRGQVSVLILTPTRDMGSQIELKAARLVSKFKRPLEVHQAFGGTPVAPSHEKFMAGDPKILVATPSRLAEYLADPATRKKFDDMQTLILDEPDLMLEIGFLPRILDILRALPRKNEKNWQGMCFSATFPPEIKGVLSHVLSSDHTWISTVKPPEAPTIEGVPQFSVVIPTVANTFTALVSLIRRELTANRGDPKILVFGATVSMVGLYAELFDVLSDQLDLSVYEMHSRMTEPARVQAMLEFKQLERGIMFSSDVIGQGIDFPKVSLVVQVGFPPVADIYMQRVSGTARAGEDGRAIIILTKAESVFLEANPQFPIQPYPDNRKILRDRTSAEMASEALTYAGPELKQEAYGSYLGYLKSCRSKLNLELAEVVATGNKLAIEGMGCAKPPELDKKYVTKMGLKGVAGIRYLTKPPAPELPDDFLQSDLTIPQVETAHRRLLKNAELLLEEVPDPPDT